MGRNLINTLRPELLQQMVYNVTHLVFMASGYGENLASDEDGKHFISQYGPFLYEAAERYANLSKIMKAVFNWWAGFATSSTSKTINMWLRSLLSL